MHFFREWHYIPHVISTAKLGEFLASILKHVKHLNPSINTHGIGHSLGAHILGNIFNFGGFQLDRITGLDPAGPCFEGLEKDVNSVQIKTENQTKNVYMGLTEHAARFVDNIHTNGEIYGTYLSKGHVDIFTGWPKEFSNENAGCIHYDSSLL